ncbi:MAG: hypothetical protein J2P22_06905 [Nocardioides sp.]|nr:hypothetical protein [Nocardioides sp.]
MTRVRRGRGLAAILATIAAVTLATTAQNDAHAATGSAGAAAHKPARTTLHIHVTGCDRCSVQLQQAVNGRPGVWQTGKQRIGSDHEATFRVRSRHTDGMSFAFRAPWARNFYAVPNAVTQYAGHSIDSTIGRKVAHHARRAEGCWAGTRLGSVRLDFHVTPVHAAGQPGEPITAPLVYATHTMSSWRPMVKTFHGTIANQDAFYCSRPKTTKMTFRAPGCNGCEVQVMDGAFRPENVWVGRNRTVRNGAVTFRVPRPLTRGLSMTVQAPWEGDTGYTTVVAFRYPGHDVGDAVSFADARSHKRGFACWGGTSHTDLTIPLTVRKVMVRGTFGRTAGTIAYANTTQSWLRPVLPGRKGVIGAQDLIACQR